MMINDTVRKLNEMKLFGMVAGLESQMGSTSSSSLSFEERVSALVDQEYFWRENRRLQRLLQHAKLRESACVEDIDFKPQRGLEKAQVASLSQCNWIRHGHNLLITGATGSGKTWLACALGNQACRQGLSVSFQRLPLLLEDLAIAHGDGSFRKRLVQLAKFDLVILDDFGLAALGAQGRDDLLEVIECRSGRSSTLLTSQLPVEQWHDYLSGGNPTVADAILDRVISGSHRLALKGESMRQVRSRKSGAG